MCNSFSSKTNIICFSKTNGGNLFKQTTLDHWPFDIKHWYKRSRLQLNVLKLKYLRGWHINGFARQMSALLIFPTSQTRIIGRHIGKILCLNISIISVWWHSIVINRLVESPEMSRDGPQWRRTSIWSDLASFCIYLILGIGRGSKGQGMGQDRLHKVSFCC